MRIWIGGSLFGIPRHAFDRGGELRASRPQRLSANGCVRERLALTRALRPSRHVRFRRGSTLYARPANALSAFVFGLGRNPTEMGAESHQRRELVLDVVLQARSDLLFQSVGCYRKYFAGIPPRLEDERRPKLSMRKGLTYEQQIQTFILPRREQIAIANQSAKFNFLA